VKVARMERAGVASVRVPSSRRTPRRRLSEGRGSVLLLGLWGRLETMDDSASAYLRFTSMLSMRG
jgi:hypothetical protein